ncbi:MAG TPA: YceI family protein [Thermoanaerobaculia bacterium]|jgi:polyisoprenoid-binding protein YceI|nr:YceI family protein [Thermoanaerobaculia bacterium]
MSLSSRSRPSRPSRHAAALALLVLSAVAARAETRVLVLDPAASRVSFTLPASGHTVEGKLALKSGRITFDPATGEASGEIAVDLASARTGNKQRDQKMHEEVLETAAHPVAVFRVEKVRGAVAPSGPSRVTLDGTLTLHGADHKLSLPTKVDVQNGLVKAETRFPVPYVEWGLKDPSVMFLRVDKVVTVTVDAEGRLEASSTTASP